MAITHFFLSFVTPDRLEQPAEIFTKRHSFNTSLIVGVGLFCHEILLEGMEGSVGDDVSHLLPFLITLYVPLACT